MQIVFVLKADPEFGTGASISAEAQGSVRGDGAATVNDGRDTAMGNVEINDETLLSEAQWGEEFGTNDFSRVREFNHQ